MSIPDFIDRDTFCISDTHFGHNKVIEFEPVRSTIAHKYGFDDYEECLISRINEATNRDGVLLLLGDFAFKAIEVYSNRIEAENKIIILGNHDRKAPLYRQYGWKVIDGIHHSFMGKYNFIYSDGEISLLSGLIKDIDGERIMFSHYPVFNHDEYDRKNERIAKRTNIFEELYRGFDCNINIHGHVHSKDTTFDSCVNVSCEPLKFKPLTVGDIIDMRLSMMNHPEDQNYEINI